MYPAMLISSIPLLPTDYFLLQFAVIIDKIVHYFGMCSCLNKRISLGDIVRFQRLAIILIGFEFRDSHKVRREINPCFSAQI